MAFGGDNCNANFGGLHRRGKNNVFTKLRDQANMKMEGIGCPAHILHNTMQTSADILSCDIEAVIVKLFTYFSIYTVRTERLKDFCDFVGTEYHGLMSHSRTRWLSLYPAVTRVIEMFDALKAFFLSEEKAPATLLAFFKSVLSEAYLWLIHGQLSIFRNQTLKIEGEKKSVIEVLEIMDDTLESIKERRDEIFMSLKVTRVLHRDEVTPAMKNKFTAEVKDFYTTSFDYLSKWKVSLCTFSPFSWMLLKCVPKWEEVTATCEYLEKLGRGVDDVLLFEQFRQIKTITEREMGEDTWKRKLCSEKWVYILQQCEYMEQYSELLRLCEFIFCIPAHNANVERIFSLMNIQWSEERNRMELPTFESILQCLTNYKITCTEFYNYVNQNKKDLFPDARSSMKYAGDN